MFLFESWLTDFHQNLAKTGLAENIVELQHPCPCVEPTKALHGWSIFIEFRSIKTSFSCI